MGFGSILGTIGAGLGLPFVGSTLLAGGSSLLDYFSAKQQNEATDDRARAGMDFSSAEAGRSMVFSAEQVAKQMEFQERMSNTSHQREVQDLRSAGLNPLLSLNSGASTPGGASGTGAQGSPMQGPVVPELGAISNSAREAVSLFGSFSQSMANANAANASAEASRASAGLTRAKTPQAESSSGVFKWLNRLIRRATRFSARPVPADRFMPLTDIMGGSRIPDNQIRLSPGGN